MSNPLRRRAAGARLPMPGALALCAVLSLSLMGLPAAHPASHAHPVPAVQAAGQADHDGGAGIADAPIEAPPEPEAAAEQVLPLQLDPLADVDLDQAPIAAPEEVEVRDLQPRAPGLPSTARTFSTPEAGPASTLVLFDTTGPYAHLGEYYALGMGMLASHSGTVTTLPVTDYTAGLAGRFTAVIYSGSTYDEPLPRDFVNDVLTGDVPVLWSGFNIWQLAATEADRTAFTSRYGWDAATSYIDSADTVAAVSYNGQTLDRSRLHTGGIVAPRIIDPGAVTVVGSAHCSDAAGAATDCHTIAQTTGSSFPWAVSSGNLTYIGEVPLSYLGETDRYIAAADIVLDILQPDASPVRQAAVRIEDISPGLDADLLAPMVDYLAGAGVPFQLAVVPTYLDPKGDQNNGVPQSLTLADNPELVAVLKDAVARGGTIVQHGTTHQFGELDNPYNGVSTDDFEFIRSWCTEVNSTSAPPVPCRQDSWVQIGGALPGLDEKEAADRVVDGWWYFTEVGLPRPQIFETPHYSATAEAYHGINSVMPVRYERELLHSGLLTGAPGGDFAYYGQFFPYAVNDPYGSHVLPENLGNYEPEAQNQHPPRLGADLLRAAQCNLVNTHATASFFFHPYYDVNVLRQVVEGIRQQGYVFVPAEQLR